MTAQRGFLGIEGAAMYLVIALAVALLASLAAGSAAAWYLDGKVEEANGRATKAESSRAAEEQSRKGFQAAASSCSAGVESLQAAWAAKEAGYKAQLERGRKATQEAQDEAERIRNAPRPVGMDECTATRKELDDEVDRRAARK